LVAVVVAVGVAGLAFTSTTGATADSDLAGEGGAGTAVAAGFAIAAGAAGAERAAMRVTARLAAGFAAVVRTARVDLVGAGAASVVVSVTGVAVDEFVTGAVSVVGAGSVVVGGAVVSVVTGWDCGTSWASAVVEVSARAAAIAGRALVCA